MLFVVTVGIGIFTLVLAIVLDDTYGWREGISIACIISSVLAWFAAVIMFFIIAANNLGAQGTIAANQQRYESLVYQLNNDLYDNDNDLGKKDLYNQIQEWNEYLATGKAMQHDFWLGVFYSDIYDQFEFIELNKE